MLINLMQLLALMACGSRSLENSGHKYTPQITQAETCKAEGGTYSDPDLQATVQAYMFQVLVLDCV